MDDRVRTARIRDTPGPIVRPNLVLRQVYYSLFHGEVVADLRLYRLDHILNEFLYPFSSPHYLKGQLILFPWPREIIEMTTIY
ncbi:hypothetical protein K474DRAFT_1670033 [Panus rudis PR-1116 ss-1]|nr:hypothetical protein K474DRAFT_1670033 [Panus rudis PR-1116 ss-1]